jgi:type IV pilus assembly protein PilC
MPKYKYVAKTQEGRTVSEVAMANTKTELINRLRAKGLFIVSINEIGERIGKPSFFSAFFRAKGKRSSLKLRDLTFFARNLSTMLSSGVTLLRSLEIISAQTESLKLGNALKKVCSDVKGGLGFGEAIAKYPTIFSTVWQGIVKVGETSGNLPFVLEKLADYLDMKMEFERKIKSALIYPGILFVAASGAMFVFFRFILPKFSEIFSEFDVEMPLPTQILFNLSNFINKHFYPILALVIGAIVFFVMFRKQKAFKVFWDNTSYKLPLIGDLTMTFYLERITSTMYILLDSGLPVVYALEITTNSVGNVFFEKILATVKEKIREGSALSDELAKVEVFPLLLSEMARIGEETGTMPEVFSKVSSHYQKDLSANVERIVAAFEPIMIIIMGVVIGGIVISLFLPLFKIATAGG